MQNCQNQEMHPGRSFIVIAYFGPPIYNTDMKPRCNEGSSLTELMITLLVAAILLRAALPSFRGLLEREELTGAAEAIKQLKIMTVTYTADGGAGWRIGIRDGAPCDTTTSDPEAPGACSLPGSDRRTLALLRGDDFRSITASSTRAATRFDPVNGTSIGSNATIVLTSPSGHQVEVRVGNIGRVRICSDNGPGKVARFPSC